MPKHHCCSLMTAQVTFTCAEHPNPFDCPDCLIHYSERFDEYGLILHDGGTARLTIDFCPWCGTRLPESQRDRWFEELAALGFDDPGDQAIPERYQTGAWYRGGTRFQR
ncbi:DUF6980 family protein [Armatimonas rosea]|uniref:DUF6980 domain-containing protein n=1 Tax=Armatimonas rosea TaxID=685828 RepID=A0A7W9SM46_ARMRO|nr:hypothetical protein [Armatimonas rosea]MBB6048373.1 hypothetical protein [Armatimonas rosea]